MDGTKNIVAMNIGGCFGYVYVIDVGEIRRDLFTFIVLLFFSVYLFLSIKISITISHLLVQLHYPPGCATALFLKVLQQKQSSIFSRIHAGFVRYSQVSVQ